MRIRVALVSLAALLTVFVPSAHADGPAISYTFTSATAGDNGWYLSDVAVQFTVTGGTGLNTTCPAFKTFRTMSDVLDCKVWDDTASIDYHLQFKIDKDAPSVTGAAPARGADANGWYRAPVGVSFSGSDGTSGIASCTQPTFSGPDSATAAVSGTCRDKAGNTSAPSSWGLKYDATAPSVSGKLARAADANGWYNHAVRLELKGDDGVSGIASCDAPTYSGPDTTAGSVSGSCRDTAGNAASQTVALKYDSTPPKLRKLVVAPTNRGVTLTWATSADTAAVTVQRAPLTKSGKVRGVYRGTAKSFTDRGLTNGLRYRYSVAAVDAAGNAMTVRATAMPRALIAPAPGAKLRRGRPPTLSWARDPKASYYNVQLYLGRAKVLSAWPKSTKLKLQGAWTYGGRRMTFGPGRYRWYVFPGRGARAANRYGALLGSSTFVVR